MAVLYVLAHFDDEYFAYPLIWRDRAEGHDQHFVYVCDYADEVVARRRHAESLSCLASLGVAPEQVKRLSGFPDGSLHLHLPEALQALRETVAGFGAIDRIVVSAWEGGHADHDVCAAMAVELAYDLGGVPIDQFALYNGPDLPFFRAGAPLIDNGVRRKIAMPLRGWMAYLAAVRFFPSQWKTWIGLWPLMWATYLTGGYAVQSLAAPRIAERPHAGPLLYERRFKVAYAEVQARVGMITRAPPSISA